MSLSTPASLDLPQQSRALETTERPARAPGFPWTLMKIELRRMLRNKRTLIFSLLFPIGVYVAVTASLSVSDQPLEPGVRANVAAYILVSMGLYAAIAATTAAGASVAIERASGWSRRLRVTPLRPTNYVMVKVLVALLMGLLALSVTVGFGLAQGKAVLETSSLVQSVGFMMLGGLIFAAFGVFMGYLLVSDSVMQVLGPVLAVLAICGGLFSGPIEPGSTFEKIAQFTPIWGISGLVHWPLSLSINGGHTQALDWRWVVNVVAWLVIFLVGAAWRFRRDTARV